MFFAGTVCLGAIAPEILLHLQRIYVIFVKDLSNRELVMKLYFV